MGILDALTNAVMRRESSMNPDDPNAPTKPLSMLGPNQFGARGVMQIKPSTAHDAGYGTPSIHEIARGMGYESDGSLRAAAMLVDDPDVARAFGRAYLDALNNRFGGLDAAAGAYNMGPVAMANWNGNYADLPAETRDYIAKIRQYWTDQTGQPFPMTMSPRPMARPEDL